VASNRRPAPRRNGPHLFIVPDDAQPPLWDSGELRRLARLRQLAVDTGASEEAIRLIDGAATADEAMEQLVIAGLMLSEPDAFPGMLSWFTPLLEPGCDQFDAEVCGAEFVGELRRACPPDEDVSGILREVLEHLAEYDSPEALAMTRILAAVGPPEIRPIAEGAAIYMAMGGQPDLPWATGLGLPQPGPCFGYGDLYGARRSIVVVFSYAHRKHAIVVLVDNLLGGGVKDCYPVEYSSRLRDDYREACAKQELGFRDLDTAMAREVLETALAEEPCPVEPDEIQHVENYLDLLRARVDLLPRRASSTGTARPGTGTTGKRPQAPRNVHRLKVTLRGSKPPIWRRFEVPSDLSLARLHTVIQLGFSWQDSHLWVFETPTGRYGSSDPELGIRSAASKKLSAVADWPGDKIRYEYDFSESWEHDVVVEAVEPAQPDVAYPRCTGGKRTGPPADPDSFDLDAAQKALARISKVLIRS
jgi:hypothetical protein